MATFRTTSISDQSSTKQHPFLLFLALLFIFLVIVHSAESPLTNPSSMASSSIPTTAHRLILMDSSSTMNLQPKKKQNSHSSRPSSSSSTTSTRKEFEAGAHEVPSGPNPISN
ncbi:CLAVATA3/ESR (CLE)-related protein 41-like [Cornus florida]|uniref:CLAVATA3/ESR (CLE)-related protein 41-like n=1 Tax=Cornus florida TaxID=4283 RepID=UPI00289BEFEB|nr:CLAVATA3/ESR (CLE)-related protein 41-like [Cornus florida]